MKSFVAAGALLAALASAQSIADLPSCSLTCIVNGVTSVGCGVSDFTCSCKAADKLAASVTPCVQSACDAADQAKVITVLEGICAGVGIPVTISAPGSGATSSPAPASSSAAAPPASSSSEAAPTSSAAAPASYSSGAPASSACTSSTVYTTVTASSGSYPTYGSNGTVTTAPPAPAYTGAASSNSAVFGAAGLFGLLAYIL